MIIKCCIYNNPRSGRKFHKTIKNFQFKNVNVKIALNKLLISTLERLNVSQVMYLQ